MKKAMLRRVSMMAVLAGILVLSRSSIAGPVSLYPNQVDRLRNLVKSDVDAADQYNKIRKAAKSALNSKPQPAVNIIGRGRLNSDPQKKRSDISRKDFDKIAALAWSWLLDGDARYAAKGREFIIAWAETNKSDGDPINETTFGPLIEAYDILRPTFSGIDRAIVDAWLREKAATLWSDPRERTQNWQSHRLKMVGTIAMVLEDDALWQTTRQGFREQIDNSFSANGESVDFVRRDALHYHLYSVAPLLVLACVARQHHENWYDYVAPSGASLRKAVNFIEPFAFGKEAHIEFKNSAVKFDRTRASAGQAEYSPHVWSTCNASPLFSEASCVDREAESIALKTQCGTAYKRFVDWQGVLNAVRSER